MKNTLLALALILVASPTFAAKKSANEANSQKPKQGVSFANLKDGQTIPGDYLVKFAVDGKEVRPAGEVVEGTGHHHIIINGETIAEGQVVPATETSIHFGKGQTEYKLDLKPGNYRLTLQFANGAHISYGPKYSKTVRVVVK